MCSRDCKEETDLLTNNMMFPCNLYPLHISHKQSCQQGEMLAVTRDREHPTLPPIAI